MLPSRAFQLMNAGGEMIILQPPSTINGLDLAGAPSLRFLQGWGFKVHTALQLQVNSVSGRFAGSDFVDQESKPPPLQKAQGWGTQTHTNPNLRINHKCRFTRLGYTS